MKEPESIDVMKRRLMAIDMARVTTSLTEEKYFSEAVAALKSKNKKAFLAVCQKAGILPTIAEQLWKCLIELMENVGVGWIGSP